jgi:uncharacterized protein
MPLQRKDPGVWGSRLVTPGQELDLEVPISESYCGRHVSFPVHVKRGPLPGPAIFLTAAVHGDELNGTAAIRSLIGDPELHLLRGTLIMVPVINVLGFETHSRYLPDRRDLNRCFPGSANGSQASRLARVVFEEIVGRSDFGIDLHTAAIRRTNHPNVRGDLSNPQIRVLADSFGCEILVDEPGPEGAFRRAATDAGCPTIILEAGEIWKMEPNVVQVATRGIKNVLRSFQMIEGTPSRPPIQHRVTKTQWIRANHAGFLEFHVVPGSVVRKDQPLATSTTLLGRRPVTILAPGDGIILGLTTLPVTAPGEPVCHLAHLDSQALALEAAIVRLTDVA